MKKKLAGLTIALFLVLGLTAAITASDYHVNANDSRTVITYNLDTIYNGLVVQIIEDFGHLYRLENFSYDFSERTEENVLYVDINIYVDMTLTRHPRYNPFVLGLEQALLHEPDELNIAAIQSEINDFLTMAESSYNVPIRATFTYTIVFPAIREVGMVNTNDFEVFYRVNSENGFILIPESELAEVENTEYLFELGRATAQEAVQAAGKDAMIQSHAIQSSVWFSPEGAAWWALNNVFNPQEIPNSVVPGLNCANFVSWALHAGGGLPTSNAWRPAPVWGASWPSDNWMRTGFHNNGGVTTYLRNRGWFGRVSNSQRAHIGSIAFWTQTSHVAIVTSNDGTSVFITENGAAQNRNVLLRAPAVFYVFLH